MFNITNKTGYMILLPNGKMFENEKVIKFESIQELPDVEDIALMGFRENRDGYIYMTEYQRDSFGDIICEYRINYYLI
jgi:hypothetical protein